MINEDNLMPTDPSLIWQQWLTSGSPLTKSSSSRSTLTRCSAVDIGVLGLVIRPPVAPVSAGPDPPTWVTDSTDGVLAGRGSVEKSSSLPCAHTHTNHQTSGSASLRQPRPSNMGYGLPWWCPRRQRLCREQFFTALCTDTGNATLITAPSPSVFRSYLKSLFSLTVTICHACKVTLSLWTY